jgi:hypothetical protein
VQNENAGLKQRVQELERGLKLLRSVVYSPAFATSQHDLKFADGDSGGGGGGGGGGGYHSNTRTSTSSSTSSSSREAADAGVARGVEGLLAREHDIIQRQSDLLLSVRRELVTKAAEHASQLQRLEADLRAAARARHAAECELHWKRHDQDARIRSLEGLLHLRRDASSGGGALLSPAQRLASVALQLQEEQARAAELRVQVSRATLREAAAREEAAALKAAADASATDLAAMRLALACVGIGVHPAEAVAKLLKSMRAQTAAAAQQQQQQQRRQQQQQQQQQGGKHKASGGDASGAMGDDSDGGYRGGGGSGDGGGGGGGGGGGLSKEFYTAGSLETFEDLVQNVMTIQVFDAAAVASALHAQQRRQQQQQQQPNAADNDDHEHPDAKLAVVNHSFLIACLRLVGSVRAAWAREAAAEVRCALAGGAVHCLHQQRGRINIRGL